MTKRLADKQYPRGPSLGARFALGLLSLAAASCNVSTVGEDTGGVPQGHADGCPAGVTVVLTDFLSTQIALSSLEGKTQSESFMSTGSKNTAGLAFALSGDVVVPSEAPASGAIVLIDRFGTNVLTFADPETAEVWSQLEVGTGFDSNPQDYLEVGEGVAFLTRYGENRSPDREPFDSGSDVLVLDVSDLREPRITGSIRMPSVSSLPPRPGSMTRVGDQVIVTLERLSLDFKTTGETMYVGVSIESHEVLWQKTLSGLKGCGRVTPSPNGERLAVACMAAIDPTGTAKNLSESALLLFEPRPDGMREIERFTAEELAGEPLQSRAAFASDTLMLFSTQTPTGNDATNRLLSLDLTSGKTNVLATARLDPETGGKGIVYSDITCAPGCSDVCLMADADRGVLQRVRVGADDSLTMLEPVRVEDRVGLPPRSIGIR